MKRTLLACGLALVVAGALFGFVDPAFAQLINPADNPENVAGATGGQGSFRTILRQIVNFFLFFLGLVATIMIIVGGFFFITQGSGEGKEKGKTIITWAAIGIIVVLISYALVNTLLQAASNTAPTV